MAPRNLRAVSESGESRNLERQAPSKSVAQAAKSGNQRELLVSMRDRIAETVSKPDCPPRELASLTKRLQDIVRDIAALDAMMESENVSNGGTVDSTFDASVI